MSNMRSRKSLLILELARVYGPGLMVCGPGLGVCGPGDQDSGSAAQGPWFVVQSRGLRFRARGLWSRARGLWPTEGLVGCGLGPVVQVTPGLMFVIQCVFTIIMYTLSVFTIRIRNLATHAK